MRGQGASPGARIIVGLVRGWIRAQFHVEVHGLEHFTGSPSTLVVSNHRRDADGPIIGTGLLRWMDDMDTGAAPWFVAREDLFRRGFLRHYLTDWPSPVRALLGGLSLRPVLQMLHLCPIRRIRERTLGEVLEDIPTVLGDLSLAEVLRPCVLARFRRQTPSGSRLQRVSDALQPRYRSLLRQQYGLMKLTRACFRRLRPHEEAVIGRQLNRFVDLLEEGAVMLLEPEGAISVDGSLGRLRLGLHILLNRPRVPVRVLPVGIVYDFMTRERPWVFVHIGREIPDLGGLSRRETSCVRAAAAM
jgi:1-acyl-sn-glycerol-3-phosphate acyltransferase